MNNSLINQTFKLAKKENRPALLTYTVAGDNTKKKSLEILKSISKYADICELGFPHNTPIADGGQIQTSAYRAIKNNTKIIQKRSPPPASPRPGPRDFPGPSWGAPAPGTRTRPPARARGLNNRNIMRK